MKSPLRGLVTFFLLLAATASAGAEAPVLRLKFVSRNAIDGSYTIMVDNAVRRVPSVAAVNEDHHLLGTLYKVELYAPGLAGPELYSEKLSKIQLVHEVTGARIILMFGLTAVIEDPDGPVPRVRPDSDSD